MNILRYQARACAVILAALATSVNASSVTTSLPFSVAPDASFSISVFGNFDDVGGLGAGGFDILYDAAVFQVTGFTHALAVDNSFSCPGAASCPPFDGASPDTAAFANFNGLIAPGAGITLIGTIDVTAIGAGSSAFTLQDNASFTGSWLDNGTNSVASPSFTGTSVSVSAIPVPAAVWLFGSGLLGLVGVARRKKTA